MTIRNSDQRVMACLVLSVLLYLLVLIIGFANSNVYWLTILLNLATGTSLIMYWLYRQIIIQQHYLEAREIAVLIFEAAIICLVVYCMLAKSPGRWLRMVQYVFFSIHLGALVLLLTLMLTFKMTKLI